MDKLKFNDYLYLSAFRLIDYISDNDRKERTENLLQTTMFIYFLSILFSTVLFIARNQDIEILLEYKYSISLIVFISVILIHFFFIFVFKQIIKVKEKDLVEMISINNSFLIIWLYPVFFVFSILFVSLSIVIGLKL